MTGLGIFGLILALAAVVAVTGWRPTGSRPASDARLMSVARVLLILVGFLCILLVWQAYGSAAPTRLSSP